MRKPILILLLCFPFILPAQHEFAPVGATWYYYSASWQNPQSIFTVTVTGIDTIQGRACKHINGAYSPCAAMDFEYFYEENGKVYALINSVFSLYIDFTAEPGDRWSVKAFQDDSLTIQVDFISWLYLSNGDSLRVQNVSFPYIGQPGGPLAFWGTQIAERMGCIGFIVPQSPVCDPVVGGFFCYMDSTFQQPDTCLFHVATHEALNRFSNQILFPNPASEIVSIRSDFEADKVIFQDIFGHQQYLISLNGDLSLDLSSLKSGIYVACFFNKNMLVAKDKLVIVR